MWTDFNVVLMQETFCQEKGINLKNSQIGKKFNWWIADADRNKRRGRPMGGLFIGTDVNLDSKIILKERNIMAINLVIGEEIWIVVNVYLRENKERCYEKLKKIIDENKNHNILIMGGMNATLAEMQMGWIEGEMEQREDVQR